MAQEQQRQQHRAPVKPLKILELRDNSSEVDILKENLAIVGKNLEESGASHVSIISVMGQYRTGKSFLLDLLSRFLKVKEEKIAAAEAREKERLRQEEQAKYDASRGAKPEVIGNAISEAVNAHEQDAVQKEAARKQQQQGWRFGENDNNDNFVIADWILSGDASRISEGTASDSSGLGFEWKGGHMRCTRGIWVWDKPLVFTNKEGLKVAVLLMDTQGAWDSTMTQAQSATIFGLTALLSSKLVFNLQNRIDESSINNMDYILTFTQTICNELPGADSPFGGLTLLMRDWANYEDGCTLDECHRVMQGHLDQHLSTEAVREEAIAKVERLKSTFRSIRAFGLPHPGKQVAKLQYEGDIAVIEKDFLFLLDDFMEQFLGEEFPEPSAPLGTQIKCSHFMQVVMNFAEAFGDNAEARATDLRKAFVTVEMMSSKEQLLAEFKTRLARIAPDLTVLDPITLKEQVEKVSQEMKHDYHLKLKPWKLKASEEHAATHDFNALVDDIAKTRVSQNDSAVNGAAVKLVASPVVGCVGYFMLVHPYAAVAAAVGGIYMQVKKWTSRTGGDALDQRVIAGMTEDTQNWCVQRYVDAQAILVTLQRLTPDKAREHLAAAQQQGAAMLVGAAAQGATGSGAAASSSR